jgi:hypothetical protein
VLVCGGNIRQMIEHERPDMIRHNLSRNQISR